MAIYMSKKQIDWYMLGWLLVGDVRETLANDLTPQSLAWLEPIVDTLVVCLRHPDSNPGNEPIAQNILQDFPEWNSEFEEMNSQRAELIAALDELSLRINWTLPVQQLAEYVRGVLSDWVENMMDLQARERDLVQAAYYWEVGTAG